MQNPTQPRASDQTNISRRRLLRLSAASATILAANSLVPGIAAVAAPRTATPDLYASTLRSWCDAMLAHQLTMTDRAFYGALLCPSCGLIHGRCADAMYPMMHMAHKTGDQKYLRSAIALHNWSEYMVSQPVGSWRNDIALSAWEGITVFHSIALAESLHHHGAILDAKTRAEWTDRLAKAARFLDGFITIQTGNINYPITSCHAFALFGLVLGDSHYTDRARQQVQQAMEFFTPNALIFGEGHPLEDVTRKGCRAVDLGYNVEESLPALTQYALLTGDTAVLDQVVKSMKTHVEFLLPNGAWDNSWGTRNYKWSYWGSRTSDGCFPAFVLLTDKDPRFKEVAYRNLRLMADCTHDGLLYGGPDYLAHGDHACIHHVFTHSKAIATAIDSGVKDLVPKDHPAIPRDEPYTVKHFPEIGTYLASTGPWRATVTEYDWDYNEVIHASGNDGPGGGHASGGTMSQLYHQQLGQILVASMTEYSQIEVSNMQVHSAKPHMPLSMRIEIGGDTTYNSLSDLQAKLTASSAGTDTSFDATGKLLTAKHHPVPGAGVSYRLQYEVKAAGIIITALATGILPANATINLILPIVSRTGEPIAQPTPGSVIITKPKGDLKLQTDAAHSFAPVPKERTFNLVPGLEAAPLMVALTPGIAATVTISA